MPIELPDLTPTQITTLIDRHHLDPQRAAIAAALIELVAGHPHLVRLGLYWLSQPHISPSDLLQQAPTPSGIYGDHLRRHWQVLQQQPDLWFALQQVVAHDPEPVTIAAAVAHRLHNTGLIGLNGNQATLRRQLYRCYFAAQEKLRTGQE